MVKWEYYTEYVDDLYSKELEDLGQQGWELVTVANGIAYFKRPVDEVEVRCFDEDGNVRTPAQLKGDNDEPGSAIRYYDEKSGMCLINGYLWKPLEEIG